MTEKRLTLKKIADELETSVDHLAAMLKDMEFRVESEDTVIDYHAYRILKRKITREREEANARHRALQDRLIEKKIKAAFNPENSTHGKPASPSNIQITEIIATSDNTDDPSSECVTHKFEPEGHDDRAHSEPPVGYSVPPGAREAPVMNKATEEIINNRYRVLERNVGGPTGEADIYKCIDEETGEAVALKQYRNKMQPKDEVLRKLRNLSHDGIVRVIDYGDWEGRFFEVMEYCEGGRLSDRMPVSESVLEDCIRKILDGLNFLHSQGIVHRDIKPSNLLIRNKNNWEIAIADFGICSILESDEFDTGVRKTGTFNLTADYASPELIEHKEVGPKTDYYALAITLIHLYQGRSPFEGQPDVAIGLAHKKGDIPIPDNLSDKFKTLLSGLTQFEADNRWGYNQVMSWLKNERVLDDFGRPWKAIKAAGMEHPYSRFPEAKNPKQLARVLSKLEDPQKMEAKKDLFRGEIRHWVHLFDSELSDRIYEIEEVYGNQQDLGLFILIYILDSTLPLAIGEAEIYSAKDLLSELDTVDEKRLKAVETAMWDGRLEYWVDFCLDKSKKLGNRIRDIKEMHAINRRLGLFHLKYFLDPGLPFRITDSIVVNSPGELPGIIVKNPGLRGRMTSTNFINEVCEWLSAVLTADEKNLETVDMIKKVFQRDRRLGLNALRWKLGPDKSLILEDGNCVETPKALARVIDESQRPVDLANRLLANRWIETWLDLGLGWKIENKIKAIRENSGISKGKKCQLILEWLDPKIAQPRVTADRTKVRPGWINSAAAKTVTVNINNEGRGYLWGTCAITGMNQGVTVNKSSFEGNRQSLKLSLNTAGLPVGKKIKSRLEISTNGGNLEIPISFRASAPFFAMIGRSLIKGMIFASALGLIRFLLGEQLTYFKNAFIAPLSFDERIRDLDYMILLYCLVVMAVLGCSCYYLYRFNKVAKENENQ